MALVAAKLGARRVYAVEPSAALQLGREAARANGLAERIEFFEAMASEVTLPELADVLVSDLRGTLPLYQSHLLSIADARRRLLAPGATIIPREDSLWAAIVEAREAHESLLRPWFTNGYGVDLSAGRSMSTSTLRGVRLKAEQLLSQPLVWETLDYRTREQTDAMADVCFEIDRPGDGHGIGLWFDSVLTDDVSITNAPGGAKLIYGQTLLPWPEAVSLQRGDEIAVSLRAAFVGHDYAWRWTTRVERRGCLVVTFEQSSLAGAPLSLSLLRKRREGYVPVLTEDGEIDRDVLSQINGKRTLGEVALLLAERHPRRFSTWKDALRRACALSGRYR
jgi:protein arginine N-methyltransferase 1